MGATLIGVTTEDELVKATNSSFILNSAYLVFMMQTGFMALSVGVVRSKNVKNIILKNLLDVCTGAIGFYVIGYGLAFGDKVDPGTGLTEGNGFIGTRYFALEGLAHTARDHWMFMYAFCATSNTIVSGAVAERTRFEAYLLYSLFMSIYLYPIVVHWMWSGSGWLGAGRSYLAGDLLFGSGAIDFAGSGVVHVVGGLSALAGAYVVGPRLGRFVDGRPMNLPGHNAAFQVLGVFLLWFGFYGFNPGSALDIVHKQEVVSNAAIVTTLGASSGCLSALLWGVGYFKIKQNEIIYDLGSALNGVLAGLVSVTAGCGVIRPWAGIVHGLVGGIVYFHGARFVAHTLQIDDPIDAVAVHAFCGYWGVLATGLFADKALVELAYGPRPDHLHRHYGGWVGSDGKLFACQIIECLVLTGWVLGHMIPFFYVLRKLNLLRVPVEEELRGIDIKKHGGLAYPENPQKEDFELSVHPFTDKVEAQMNLLRMQVQTLERRLTRAFPSQPMIKPPSPVPEDDEDDEQGASSSNKAAAQGAAGPSSIKVTVTGANGGGSRYVKQMD